MNEEINIQKEQIDNKNEKDVIIKEIKFYKFQVFLFQKIISLINCYILNKDMVLLLKG